MFIVVAIKAVIILCLPIYKKMMAFVSLIFLAFWVTLPCAVHFLICAQTNGGNVKKTNFIR
jgi:hypothetical protein